MRFSKALDIGLFAIALYGAASCFLVYNWNAPADDFASTYVAAQLLREGKGASLYEYDPYQFDKVPPGAFAETAQQVGFTGYLHPYVHVPLAALVVRPLLVIPYTTAARVMLAVNVCSLLLSLYLLVRMTARHAKLRWFCLAAVAMLYFYPLRYGLWLGQTTPLVLLGVTALYCLAAAGHHKTAGIILGGVISLKIAPLLLLFYFLLRRKWLLAMSCAVSMLLIGLCSLMLAGGEGNLAFLKNIVRISGLSLASWNNVSLDGFLLRWVCDASYIFSWQVLELPAGMKIVKWLAVCGLLVLWFSLLRKPGEREGDHLGFSFTLVLVVIIPAISWSHYFLLLVIPYLLLLSDLKQRLTIPRRKLLAGGVFFSYLGVGLPPTYIGVTYPLSYGRFLNDIPLVSRIPLPLLSSLCFLGGVLLLVLIVWRSSLRDRGEGTDGSPGLAVPQQGMGDQR